MFKHHQVKNLKCKLNKMEERRLKNNLDKHLKQLLTDKILRWRIKAHWKTTQSTIIHEEVQVWKRLFKMQKKENEVWNKDEVYKI